MIKDDDPVVSISEPAARDGSGKVIVRRYLDGTTAVISEADAAVLDTCQSAIKACDMYKRVHGIIGVPLLTEVIDRLIDARLLAHLSASLSTTKGPSEASPDDVPTLAMVTKDRPALALNAIRSNGCRMQAGGSVLWVIDDSQSVPLAPQPGCRVVTRVDRLTMAKTIARAIGADSGTLEFALCGTPDARVTTGAARNTALLLAAGTRLIMVDDDIGPDAFLCNEHPEHVSVSTVHDPYRVKYSWLAPRPTLQRRTAIACHSEYLGHSALAVMSGYPSMSVTGRVFTELRRGDTRLSVTGLGINGDEGVTSNSHRPMAIVEQRGVDTSVTRDAFTGSRLVTKSVPCLVITPPGYVPFGSVGIDGRRLVPPCLPVGRGEDSWFCFLLALCDPRSRVAHIPAIVEHRPPEPRSFSPEEISSGASTIRLLDVLKTLATFASTSEVRTADENIAAVGEFFQSLRGARVAEACEFALLRIREGRIRLLVYMLSTFGGAPDYVQPALKAQIDTIEQSLSHANQLVDCGDAGGPRDVLKGAVAARIDSVVAMVGRVLVAWPAIYRYCATHETWRRP